MPPLLQRVGKDALCWSPLEVGEGLQVLHQTREYDLPPWAAKHNKLISWLGRLLAGERCMSLMNCLACLTRPLWATEQPRRELPAAPPAIHLQPPTDEGWLTD